MNPLDLLLLGIIAILGCLLFYALVLDRRQRYVIRVLDGEVMELRDRLKASNLALDHSRQALNAKRRIHDKIERGPFTGIREKLATKGYEEQMQKGMEK